MAITVKNVDSHNSGQAVLHLLRALAAQNNAHGFKEDDQVHYQGVVFYVV